jgi:hypothetical protein
MKTYKVEISGRRDRIVEGTLTELISYFSYTLEIGHSYNNKINKTPTTIKSFISNLQKSFKIKEGSCYEKTFITLIG